MEHAVVVDDGGLSCLQPEAKGAGSGFPAHAIPLAEKGGVRVRVGGFRAGSLERKAAHHPPAAGGAPHQGADGSVHSFLGLIEWHGLQLLPQTGPARRAQPVEKLVAVDQKRFPTDGGIASAQQNEVVGIEVAVAEAVGVDPERLLGRRPIDHLIHDAAGSHLGGLRYGQGPAGEHGAGRGHRRFGRGTRAGQDHCAVDLHQTPGFDRVRRTTRSKFGCSARRSQEVALSHLSSSPYGARHRAFTQYGRGRRRPADGIVSQI